LFNRHTSSHAYHNYTFEEHSKKESTNHAFEHAPLCQLMNASCTPTPYMQGDRDALELALKKMQDREIVYWAPEHACCVVLHADDPISHDAMLHVICLDGMVLQTHRHVPCCTRAFDANCIGSSSYCLPHHDANDHWLASWFSIANCLTVVLLKC
jgi:hypothetical protein